MLYGYSWYSLGFGYSTYKHCSLDVELLAKIHIRNFAYRPNRSMDDAIALTVHTALSHMEMGNTYVRMLFIDYSSAFNSILPVDPFLKLKSLGLRIGSLTSSILTLSTTPPWIRTQGCVFTPLLYTHNCAATHSSNAILGLITNNGRPKKRVQGLANMVPGQQPLSQGLQD